LTELLYGILRWRGRLDWTIRHFSKTPFEKIEIGILNTLRLGSYQILFLTRTPASAAVNESVELAKRIRGRGGASFVNAVLRSLIRQKGEIPYPKMDEDPGGHMAVTESHPSWLIRRWLEEMGVEETLRICKWDNQIAPLTLRTNTLKIDREQLIMKLRDKGLSPSPTLYSSEGIMLGGAPPVSELPFFKEGLYVIQDEASQLVTSILDPRPGECIFDACAAPGGKTTHIAQRMKNEGEVYALDLNRQKLGLIEEACQRVGIKIVKVLKGDASHSFPTPKGMKFDRILADVPCSGFGTLRRNPDLRWRKGEEEIKRLSEVQSSILRNLSSYVKEGGILVYSTCTVFHEENEDVVERFLSEHPEFQLDQIDQIPLDRCHPFIKKGYLKTFPPMSEMDGFFAVRLSKI